MNFQINMNLQNFMNFQINMNLQNFMNNQNQHESTKTSWTSKLTWIYKNFMNFQINMNLQKVHEHPN